MFQFVEITYNFDISKQIIFKKFSFWRIPSIRVKSGESVCSGFICWLFCISLQTQSLQSL